MGRKFSYSEQKEPCQDTRAAHGLEGEASQLVSPGLWVLAGSAQGGGGDGGQPDLPLIHS